MFDITVSVETAYIEHESDPLDLRYVHAYQITITNGGDVPAQLIARHWYIKHADDKLEEVQGEGVVGKQPWIQPGESFQYTSGAVLETEYGSMSGYYVFKDAEQNGYRVEIPEFLLTLENDFIH